MHKKYNIISKFFSLLTNHINAVRTFSHQTNAWLLEDDNDLYYEALTDYIFNKNLLSCSRRFIVTIREINNLNIVYANKLALLANVLDLLKKEMVL